MPHGVTTWTGSVVGLPAAMNLPMPMPMMITMPVAAVTIRSNHKNVEATEPVWSPKKPRTFRLLNTCLSGGCSWIDTSINVHEKVKVRSAFGHFYGISTTIRTSGLYQHGGLLIHGSALTDRDETSAPTVRVQVVPSAGCHHLPSATLAKLPAGRRTVS